MPASVDTSGSGRRQPRQPATSTEVRRKERRDEESSSAKPAGLKTKMKGKDQFLERRKWQPQSYLSQSHRAAVLPGGCRKVMLQLLHTNDLFAGAPMGKSGLS